jgi:hypothetical protein
MPRGFFVLSLLKSDSPAALDKYRTVVYITDIISKGVYMMFLMKVFALWMLGSIIFTICIWPGLVAKMDEDYPLAQDNDNDV